MRRGLTGLLTALLVMLALPAHVQGQGVNGAPQLQPESHTLIDATVKVGPGENDNLCVQIPSAGLMRVALQTTDGRDEDPLGPPEFYLAPYRTSPPGPGAPPELWGIPVTAAKASFELPVVAGLYCFGFNLATTPEVSTLPSRERRARFRYVGLNLTITPGP